MAFSELRQGCILDAKVLLLGAGDVGLQIADGLLRRGGIRRLTVADVNAQAGARVAMLNSCHSALVAFVELDALDDAAMERLLRHSRPDLVVQCASLISPWSIIGREHPTARALGAAGIGIQLPLQLPIVITLMRALRDLGWTIPVANLSMPDIIHPLLETRGLAPTIGLGNVSILLLRCLAAWKRREQRDARPGDPLLRVIGHHCQVYDVMQAQRPSHEPDRVRVYLGAAGDRDDELAYLGESIMPGRIYNVITAASTLPVLGALLPGAAAVRFSAPAPFGLPGGYPLRFERQQPLLDLPIGVDLDDAVRYNRRLGRRDGVDTIDSSGVVHFTEAARSAVQALDPALAEPLDCDDLAERGRRLREVIAAMGPV